MALVTVQNNFEQRNGVFALTSCTYNYLSNRIIGLLSAIKGKYLLLLFPFNMIIEQVLK